jgi:hypothetical protein
VAYGDVEIAEKAVFDAVNPTMDGEFLAALPGVVGNGGVANVDDLFDDVEFAEAVGTMRLVTGSEESCAVLLTNVLDVAQPIVRETEAIAALDGANSGAAIVAANDDVFDLQDIDGELENGEAVEIAVGNDVGEVAVDEHFAG